MNKLTAQKELFVYKAAIGKLAERFSSQEQLYSEAFVAEAAKLQKEIPVTTKKIRFDVCEEIVKRKNLHKVHEKIN